MREKSHGCSPVAVGTWRIFSCYGRDDPSKLVFVHRRQELQSSYEAHIRNLLEAWQGNTDASRDEAGDGGSLSSCHSDIGLPINFQRESGIVTF